MVLRADLAREAFESEEDAEGGWKNKIHYSKDQKDASESQEVSSDSASETRS